MEIKEKVYFNHFSPFSANFPQNLQSLSGRWISGSGLVKTGSLSVSCCLLDKKNTGGLFPIVPEKKSTS